MDAAEVLRGAFEENTEYWERGESSPQPLFEQFVVACMALRILGSLEDFTHVVVSKKFMLSVIERAQEACTVHVLPAWTLTLTGS